MFGNEMRLASFDDISWLNDEVDKINMIDILIALAKGGKKSFSKSMMFLDAETTVPTILGLPLKLSAKGTTVAAVELAGKFDIRNMFWGKMSFDVRGYVKPRYVFRKLSLLLLLPYASFTRSRNPFSTLRDKPNINARRKRLHTLSHIRIALQSFCYINFDKFQTPSFTCVIEVVY